MKTLFKKEFSFSKKIIKVTKKLIKSKKLWKKLETITSSAYVQAKNKISHELFIRLNLEVVINRYYDLKENEAWYETWNNFRLLATDGSQIRLPDEKEIKEKYWTTKIKNARWNQWEYCHWLLSVLYDPLNNLAIDTILERWYYSSFLFAVILSYNKEVLFRIKTKTCKEADELFEKDCKIDSKIITLKVENKEKEYEEKYWIKLSRKLEKEIKIRLVKIILNTGEVEVLATSLLDEEKYKTEIFSELYFKRWRIEVYYDIIKNRLWLENFTWKNIESVLQDLYSSIYLSNFETILTRPYNKELELKTKQNNLRNKQKVNKQVSFNIIKNKIIELMLKWWSIDKQMKEMVKIFSMNISQERIWRTSSRKETTISKSLQFQRRKKKSCF